MDATINPLFAEILRTHRVAPAAEEPNMDATIRCPHCVGLGRMSDAPCSRCDGEGTVLACASCGEEPIDPLFAPACSGTCREAWERSQPAPIVKVAP